MKTSDLVWIQNLAQKAAGQVIDTRLSPEPTPSQTASLFLDELCQLLENYAHHFNELVRHTKPDAVCMIFKLANPRPGMMLLRGKDKLVISCDIGTIKAKIVQAHAYSETNIDNLEFQLRTSQQGLRPVWICLQDGQKVNPELIAKDYLGEFFVSGSKAFLKAGEAPVSH